MTRVRWIPVVLWAAIILTGTSLPSVPDAGPPGSDKLVHFGMYAVLGLLAMRAAWEGGGSRTIAMTLVGVALFAAVDEWHQHFIPTRSADVADWVADVAGATVGIGSLAALKLRRVKGT